MARTLTLLFRYLPNTSPNLSRLRDIVQDVFTSRGAHVTFVLGQDAPMSHSKMVSLRVGDCVTGVPLEQVALFNAMTPPVAPAGEAAVFIVRTISDIPISASGCAAHPDGRPGLILTEAAARGSSGGTTSEGRWVLTHEVGHLLGLNHVPGDAEHLMFDPPTSITSDPPQMTADDVDRVDNAPILVEGAVPLAVSLAVAGTMPVATTELEVAAIATTAAEADVPPVAPDQSHPQRRPRSRPFRKAPHVDAAAGAMAIVVDHLLRRRPGRRAPASVSVSMLTHVARQYRPLDRTPISDGGCGAVLRAWEQHGVCSERLWPVTSRPSRAGLTTRRAADAARRVPVAVQRIAATDVERMKVGVAETGAILACARTPADEHQVEHTVAVDRHRLGDTYPLAIVGYDRKGFWIRSVFSRAARGRDVTLLPYEEWRDHGLCAWLTPLETRERPGPLSRTKAAPAPPSRATLALLRPRVIPMDSTGRLRRDGSLAINEARLEEMLSSSTAGRHRRTTRVVLYAPNMGVDETVLSRFDMLCTQLARKGIECLCLIDASDVKNLADDAAVSAAVAHRFVDACKSGDGALRTLARQLAALCHRRHRVRLHLAGEGSGAVVIAYLATLLTAATRLASGPLPDVHGFGLSVRSCTLWAPTGPPTLFDGSIGEATRHGRIGRVTVLMADRSQPVWRVLSRSWPRTTYKAVPAHDLTRQAAEIALNCGAVKRSGRGSRLN